MKITRSLICICMTVMCIILYTSICYAEKWEKLTESESGNSISYIDFDSIVVDLKGKKVKCWHKIVNNKGYIVFGLNIYNMQDKTYKILSSYTLKNNVNIQSINNSEHEAKPQYIIPGTVFDRIYEVMDIYLYDEWSRKYGKK
jgi:hypothetical protein